MDYKHMLLQKKNATSNDIEDCPQLYSSTQL